jgi:hypothetical protein
MLCQSSSPSTPVPIHSSLRYGSIKTKPLFIKAKGPLSRFSAETPEPNRGDEHLVEVMYRKTIIQPDEIIRQSLSELKNKVAGYFHSDLPND